MPEFLTGQRLTADLLNDNIASLAVRFIESTPITSDSTVWTSTESAAAVVSVTAPVIIGRTYLITFTANVSTDAQTFPITSANTEIAILRIREDNVTGTALMTDQMLLTHASGNGFKYTTHAQYVADATEDKVFVITGQRNGAGSGGNQRVRASSVKPAILSVYQIEIP